MVREIINGEGLLNTDPFQNDVEANCGVNACGPNCGTTVDNSARNDQSHYLWDRLGRPV